MRVALVKAVIEDMPKIWKMQQEAFSGLLEKYQDTDTNPGAESFDKLCQRFHEPFSSYYLISVDQEIVGAMRVVDRKDGSRKRISPIWIMEPFRNRGYATEAVREAEKIHGPGHWGLYTIFQEKGCLHFYEKLGYHQTGEIRHIKDQMDLVACEKDSICYRAMSLEDYDQVYALWMSCKNMGFNDLDDSREGIARFLRRNPGMSYLAEDDGRVLAVILAGHDGRRGYIYHMSVSEEYRRLGIASRLLELSLGALKKEGINKAALLVFRRNEAGNAFWEKQGFFVRTDVAYRNKELTKLIRIDT